METRTRKRNQLGKRVVTVIGLSVVVLASSCRHSESHSSSEAMQPSSTASLPPGVTIKSYHGVGIVEEVDRKSGSIKINHDEIKGYMPAMTMDYLPRDRKPLDTVKPGDRIEFTIEDVAGIATITEIKKR